MKQPSLYLLDTNTFSFIADGRSPAARKTLELQDVQPIQAAFAKALLMKKP